MDVDNITQYIKLCIESIKDELLLFSVVAILFIVSFPEVKILVFIIYGIAVTLYAVLTSIRLSSHKFDNRFLKNFETFLENREGWEKRTINHSVVYFYTEDNSYQIVQGDEHVREWGSKIEPWMVNFPDASVFEYKVYLKHDETIISEYSFMSCDGGRYFIPLPKKRCAEPGENFICNRFEYIWHRGSIEYKIGAVFGHFYHYENLEEVARFCDIVVE